MNIKIIKQALLKAVAKCEDIELTNELFDGIEAIGTNNILQREYAMLGSIVSDAVNFLDNDITELAKAKELADFHTANKLKSNAKPLTDNEMKLEFGMTVTQIAEALHKSELAPYETVQSN